MIDRLRKEDLLKAAGQKRQKIMVSHLIDEMMFERGPEQRENIDLLEQARIYWESMSDFRKRRRRARRYHRGKQWSDFVTDPETGEDITEEEYIKRQGKVPLKQNQIRQLMKNLIGQYRNSQSKSLVVSRSKGGDPGAELLTNAIQHVQQLNFCTEIDARSVEEFALSGMVVSRSNYEYYKERNQEDVKIKNVNPNRIFFNTDIEDIRMDDLRFVGEIIDCPLDDIVSVFAKTPDQEERIRALYGIQGRDMFMNYTGLSARNIDNLDFYIPQDHQKARMYVIWYLKSGWRTYVHDYADGSYNVTTYSMKEIAAMNQERLRLGIENGLAQEEIPLLDAEPKKEQFWYVKYLTPHGHSLFEGETPYNHEEHPYTILAYPLIDGEVWGFVEDIIDQQRYINRMIILLDFIMSASAKGVLMIPEDMLGDKKPEEFAEEWHKFNGVIVYKPSKEHTHVPQQISANSTAVGIHEMLALQMQLIQDISGVHGAIQGAQAKSGTPSSLYAQEAQNASTNTLDFFHTFNFFKQKRDEKIMKLVLQFYKEERYLAIAGEISNEATKVFSPEKVAGKYFDLVISHGVNTPVYKQMLDDTLKELLMGQLIDVEMYLENSSLPFAKSLLESIRNKKNQVENGEIPNLNPDQIGAGLPPEQQAHLQSNPQAKPMIQQYLGKAV